MDKQTIVLALFKMRLVNEGVLSEEEVDVMLEDIEASVDNIISKNSVSRPYDEAEMIEDEGFVIPKRRT